MRAHDIPEVARRDWGSLDAASRAHWAGVYRDKGWHALWETAQALLIHVRQVNPAFPTDVSRDEDLGHHCALKQRFDRAAHAYARR